MAMEQGRDYGERRLHAAGGNRCELLAKSLGWFSIGLGLAEITIPRTLSRLIGVPPRSRTRSRMRRYGVREITAGIGILSHPQSAGWLWARVAGDAVDLASLGAALASDRSEPRKVGAAIAAVAGVTALDVYCARDLSRPKALAGTYRDGSRVRVKKSIVINRSPEELYRFWRNVENLPSFMTHLESVKLTGNGRSHWKAKTVAGHSVEWDAEPVNDVPNSLISWHSLESSDIENSGTVRFARAPGGRGTVVRVELSYTPPGGSIGASFAKLFGAEPGQQIEGDLRAFKQIMETGEIVKSDASIHTGAHAAQPPSSSEAGQQFTEQRQGSETLKPSLI
jgi:uncharacterized membrane protein